MEDPALNRFFSKAIEAIHNHPYKKEMNFLHAAVLVKGGRILSIGINQPRQNSYVVRFAPYEHATTHAELHAILQVRNKIDLTGAKIYVARLLREDGSVTMSKPCPWCQETLKKFGIKRVYYTTYEGGIERMNIKQLN